MRHVFIFLIALYVSPGCRSQCVSCIPQTPYQSPCCTPTSNVQTIQAARAFTNGAQGSQVVMYYNGQRILGTGQQNSATISGFNQNPASNYQNPGPIPTPASNTNAYGNNESQGNPTQSPTYLNGGVMQQQTGPTVGENVNGPNSGYGQTNQEGVEVGGVVNGEHPTQNGDQNGGIGGGVSPSYSSEQNNNGQYQGGPSTIRPTSDVGYQPFVPAGNSGYNNINGNFNSGVQPQQNGQNVMYPSGQVSDSSSSYNSANAGYIDNTQPQTYPTQIVAGGAVQDQNAYQQSNLNNQYRDESNRQNPNNGMQGNQQFDQNMNGGFVGGSSSTQHPNQENQYAGQQNQNQNQGSGQQQQFTSPGYQDHTNQQQQESTTSGYTTQGNQNNQQNQYQTTSGNWNGEQQQQQYTTTSRPIMIGNGVQGQSTTPNFNGQQYDQTSGTSNYETSNSFQTSTPMPSSQSTQFAGQNQQTSTENSNLPQAQFPSQNELAGNGEGSNVGSQNFDSTLQPQYPSQNEFVSTDSYGAGNNQQYDSGMNTQTTEGQFANGGFSSTPSSQFGSGNEQSTPQPQFPSQQELVMRDQQNNGNTNNIQMGSATGSENTGGFTPQYGSDMNTEYGHYQTSTTGEGLAANSPQFDQPPGGSNEPQNSAAHLMNMLVVIVTLLLL